MAEIEFLEGLVADQQREAAKKPKQRPHSHNQIQHHQVKYQRPHPHPVRKPPKKYVSKLDPFKMMDAPDLTKEAPKSAEYKAPVTEGPTTTVKYGELEHYNLKGYLPPLPSGYQPQHLPPVTSQPPPYAPPPPAQYNEPAPAPSYRQPPVQAPAYEAPVKAPAYEAPVKAPAYEAPAKAPAYKVVVRAPKYEAPAKAPAYEANPHPHTFFHEAQAEKVHDGEWPTVYYNTFQGNQRTLIL